MKAIVFLLSLSFLSHLAGAQNFETEIYVSPNITFGSSQAENKTSYGFSGAVSEYYYLSKVFALGTEINYTNNQYLFSQAYFGLKIPEAILIYESKINMQVLKIPINVKYKSNNNWIIQTGIGFTYLLNSNTKVDFAYSNGFSDDVQRYPVYVKDDKIESTINNYINFTFGKLIPIGKLNLLTELYFEKALQGYNFEHGGIIGESIYNYNIKPAMAGLKMGIAF